MLPYLPAPAAGPGTRNTVVEWPELHVFNVCRRTIVYGFIVCGRGNIYGNDLRAPGWQCGNGWVLRYDAAAQRSCFLG